MKTQMHFQHFLPLLRLYKIVLSIALALVATQVDSEDIIMEVIELKHRPAAEIQPLVSPLLDSSDVVIANGLSLIVKTTPTRLQSILEIINKLDTGLNNLLITVVQGRDISAEEFNAQAKFQANYNIHNPENSQIRLKGRYHQSNSKNRVNNTQTLRTLEGRPAYIKVGKVNPVEQVQLYSQGFGYPAIASTHTDYIETSTGFAVTPRLTAEDVLLAIEPWSDRMQNNGVIQTQGAATNIRTQLGVWVEIGGNTEDTRMHRDGITSEIRRTKSDSMRILIKVDKTK